MRLSNGDRESLLRSFPAEIFSEENLVTNQVELIYSNDLTKVWDGFDNGYGPTFLIYYMGESFTHSKSYLHSSYAMEKLRLNQVDDIKPLFKILSELGFKVQQLQITKKQKIKRARENLAPNGAKIKYFILYFIICVYRCV